MVVLTVYTVGYDEVRAVDTPLLRAITMGTIVTGCTGMIFVTGALVQFFTINQLQQIFGVKRMKSQIDHLNGHVIVCGFGRIGLMLAQELQAGRASFVILERGEDRVAQARNLGYLCVQGDATNEEALKEAGVTRAKALATVLPDDAANVFITLSARSLNKSLEIIARGEVPSTETKLLHAGADKVVLPTHIGAERIAEIILFPETARFIRGSQGMRDFEKTLHSFGMELEVFVAAEGSAAAHLTVDAVEAQASGSIFIVQLNRRSGETITRPAGGTRIEPGDGVVVVGRSGRMSELSSVFDDLA
jgi:voltage-gated potassium channel Kch